MAIEPPGEGWLPWSDPQAMESGCRKYWRRVSASRPGVRSEGYQTAFMTWQDLGPGLDVRGLWWRPA